MSRHPRPSLIALAALFCQFPPTVARAQVVQASSGQDRGRPTSARIARAATGEVGQRQLRDEIQGVTSLARIENRLDTRVSSRLQTRLDRNYKGLQSGANVIENANKRARSTPPAR
jgi:DNA-binding transcriptional regulator YdaS (Cro superfamily)